jgi:outer membrane protein assembly factor BamE
MQKVINALVFSALLVALAGCSSLKFPGVYRISVQQGNIIDQEMVDQLEIGMTRRQVRFIMGSPLIEDTFNPNRWDYYYSLRRGDDGELSTKHVKLIFEGDSLASLEKDIDTPPPSVSPEEVKEEVDQEDAVMPEDPFKEIEQEE